MEIPTVINSSSKIVGEFLFHSDIRVDGQLLGKVETDRSAIIGSAGYVQGTVRAKDLIVFGKLEGEIFVSGLTLLHTGSSIKGNLHTKVFEVRDGAILTAHIHNYDIPENTKKTEIPQKPLENINQSAIQKTNTAVSGDLRNPESYYLGKNSSSTLTDHNFIDAKRNTPTAELSIKEAIRQLPSDDHSSLFK